MFDPAGKLLLSDAELEAEARAVAMFEVAAYSQDEIWREDWEHYLRHATSEDEWRREAATQTLPGRAMARARAAIEAWKQNDNYDMERVSLATVIGEP